MPLTHWQSQQKPRIDAELARIVDRLRTLDPERIILFGSFARGDFHEYSDIDLVIVMNTDERFIDRISRVLEVVDQIDFDIEPHVYTPSEYAELLRCGNIIVEVAEREGKVLYERSAGQQPR